MGGIKGLAEAAAKLAGKPDDKGEDADAEPDEDLDGESDDESGDDTSAEDAMVEMAGEYRQAISDKDDKALAKVMMAMFDVCASMGPPVDLD